jgi:hypothetical protein
MRYIEVSIQMPKEDANGNMQFIPSVASFKPDAVVSYYKNEEYTMVNIVGAIEPFIVNMNYTKFKELLKG